MAIDNAKFKDQGKVPLFYVDDSGDDQPRKVYLARRDLINDWMAQHPAGSGTPPVKALDLVALFENLILGRSGNVPTLDLVFQPTKQALEAAKELNSRGLAPYSPNKMII